MNDANFEGHDDWQLFDSYELALTWNDKFDDESYGQIWGSVLHEEDIASVYNCYRDWYYLSTEVKCGFVVLRRDDSND